MQNQQPQQNVQQSSQMSPQMNHGAHELIEAHSAIGGLVGSMEQSLLYEQHIQDPELKAMSKRHKACKTQIYNTIVDTLQSVQEPNTQTQTYEMNYSNNIVYSMIHSQPK